MRTTPRDHMLLLLPSSPNAQWHVVLSWHSFLVWAEGIRSDLCTQLNMHVAASCENGLTIALAKGL